MKQKIIEISGKMIVFQEVYLEERDNSFFTLPIKFEIIGYYPGLTEVEAKRICETEIIQDADSSSGWMPKNYDYPNTKVCPNSFVESFESLLRREGIYTEISKIPLGNNFPITYEKELIKLARKSLWQKIVILKEQ